MNFKLSSSLIVILNFCHIYLFKAPKTQAQAQEWLHIWLLFTFSCNIGVIVQDGIYLILVFIFIALFKDLVETNRPKPPEETVIRL